MDLRLLIKECGFDDPNLRDEMVRDNVTFGIRDGKIRQELIKVGNTLTLDTAIDIARTHELSQSQSHTMDNEDKNIHYSAGDNSQKRRQSLYRVTVSHLGVHN